MKIYTLTNRITGKVYVGATTLSMPRRLGGHRQDAEKGKSTLIAQAIREHGWENFDVAVIATADSLESMLEIEAKAIEALNSLTPNGYNRSSYGSHRWNFTDAEKDRISASTQGRKPWNAGIQTGPMPESVKEKQRRSHRGQLPWNLGLKASDEMRLRLREAHRECEYRKNERAIEYQGTAYRSIAIACRVTGLTKMQMKYRLRKGEAIYLSRPREREK